MTHILIVGYPTTRTEAIADALRAAGNEVVRATSATEGLAAAAQLPVQLIVADWDLPQITGVAFCRELRNQGHQQIPVLLNAMQISPPNVMSVLAAGANGYLSEEMPLDIVLTRVNQCLARSHSRDGSTTSDPDSEATPAPSTLYGEVQTSREELLNVLLTTIEDLARANRLHEDELQRRREVEQKLRDSEALYESLVDNLPMNLYRKDLQGRVTYANLRYLQSRSTTFENILGKTDYDLFPKELADKYTADDAEVMGTGTVFEATESHMTPDGEKRYAHVLKTPVYDANGALVGTQGIFWDVTPRRRTEEALERERFLLRSLMDNIPDNIFFKDVEGRYLRINRAMAERLGLSDPSEAVGRLADDYFPAEYAERVRRLDHHVTSTGESIIGEEEFVRWSDGEERWLLITRMPIRDEHGIITGSFGMSHNITDHKHAQQAMQEARDAAQAASTAKSNFLANMSHEIRTPMNAIIGMTELVLDSNLAETQREYLTLVKESGESLLGIINDILDFSKIEAGKLELDPQPLQLRESLGDTLKSLAVRAHRGKLELACHVAPDVPELLVGDAGRLRQVVVNLVGNAVKFTEVGEVLVDVSRWTNTTPTLFQPDDSQIVLHFAVRDTGIGIPEDKLSKIFEAFEQVDTSLTRRFEGTGLGLAISTRLVELMGGKTWVESTVGRGSTFHFTAVFGIPQDASQLVHRSTDCLTGKRILVVDDNATNRLIMDEMLRSWSIVPVIVEGGMSAFQSFEAARELGRPFDLILSDLDMPEIDGFELVERLQASGDAASPVILMTSRQDATEIARRRGLRVAAYLTKPVKQSELFDSLVDVLAVQRVEEDHAPTERRPQHSRSLNVLLAEDSRVNQKLAVALLEKWGHQVTIANNGRQAVDTWGQRAFDVILMDVQMPDLDGLEATRQIRRLEAGSTRRTPIIALTAHALKGDEERCLDAGMDAYVTKPIRAPLLFEKLAAFCSSQDANGRINCSDQPAESPATSAARAAANTKFINWDRASDVVGGDIALLHEVLNAVLQECPVLMQALDGALAQKDSATARRAAHTILGNMRAICAEIPMEHAARVEECVKSDQLSAIAELVADLRTHCEDVYQEIRQRLES